MSNPFAAALSKISRRPDHDHDAVVLELAGPYQAMGPTHPLKALLQRVESLESLAARVRRLQDNEQVRTVLVRVSGLTCGLAGAQAISRLLAELAEHKRVVAHLQSVSMVSVLATAGATEVVAPRSAEVLLFGFGAEQLFLGKFLRTHGVEFENLRIREYKSALTRFSDDQMDEHNREQLTAYLDSAEAEWVDQIARARELPRETVAGWLTAGIGTAAEAQRAGVVHRVAYEDELVTDLADSPASGVEVLLDRLEQRGKRAGQRVAVVPVVGAIVSGRPQSVPLPPPFGPGPMAWSGVVIEALRRAKADERTSAIVLYVDSGGGSALASDLICREIETSTKPVVAVMGEVAGSGGYYVLAKADKVLASPFTLTGSIGVVSGKPVLAEFHQRHGFTPEAVGREQALMSSTARKYTDEQRAWVEDMMEEVYRQFTGVVAEGRGLPVERVDEIGRGRIWSGRDAREIDLIDDYGDLDSAIAEARRMAGLDEDAPTWVPTPKRSLLPTTEVGRSVESGLLARLWPFGGERVLAWMDAPIRVH
ncbi:S49 family peptidase [Enemella sp. A6]|uniref:S49 family peptidase n=1 Tax=Enemella sp. A6 TaxID=3440152 RepID=UPI003EB78ABE